MPRRTSDQDAAVVAAVTELELLAPPAGAAHEAQRDLSASGRRKAMVSGWKMTAPYP